MTERPKLTIKAPSDADRRPDVKRFSGNWVIYRKVGLSGYSRTAGGGRMPRFRHPTYDAAEAEAKRLARLFPDSVFVLLQEGARVKMGPQHAADEVSEPVPWLGTDREGGSPTALPVATKRDQMA